MPSLKYSEEELSIYLSTDRTEGSPGNGMTSMTAPPVASADTESDRRAIRSFVATYLDPDPQPSDWLPAMEEA
jgi:hypothetical protein